jgi:hypothetical protein
MHRTLLADRLRKRSNPDRNVAIDGVGEGPGDSVADIPDQELLKGFSDDARG